MNNTAWLARRAVLAVALMAGFYILALAISIGLIWIPYAEWVYLDRVHPKIALFCIASAGALLWAVVPRPDRFEPPGPRLDERSHRDLFKVIRRVASATKQQMPTDVFLVNEVNAWVTHRGGIMGVGSHRVMGLGLPLLQGLTVREFEAVLAHEFGHYAAGDVKLGPWIYKTRAAMGRALHALGESWLSGVFNWYGRLFLRLTHAISREQEFLADALAARTVHPMAMATALRRTEGLAPAFNAYWQSEVVPAVQAGCLPPITTGFDQYLATEKISAAVHELVSTSESHGEAGEFDTHPPLRERLAALAGLSAPQPSSPIDPPAASLLPDLEAHARALLAFAAGREECDKLRRVEWSQLAMEVYPQQWRAVVANAATFLGRFTADGIPAGRAACARAGKALIPDVDADDDLRVAYAVHVLSAGVAVALLEAGATPETGPGRPVTFTRADASLDPFGAVRELSEGTLTAEEWKARCHAMGIAGRPLGTAAPF